MKMTTPYTFLWHDYETFGLDTRRERPSQFAAIRTDADLNEIGEPIELYCQPHADYLPDPESCRITGITPQYCLKNGVSEHDFARKIEETLSLQGTIGVGYNTIRFDDEVTRNLFWRNLIAPYDREWRNQCGRWDILDLVRACYALRPNGIHWPTEVNEKGETRISLKLELLTAANGIAHEAAHDAVSDVRATIALARLIKKLQPKLFDFYLALHKKDQVQTELKLSNLHSNPKPFIHISGMFPVERGCTAVMWPLAIHPTNRNELVAWDLSIDAPSILAYLTADEIRMRIFTKQVDLPPGVTRLPIKTIHINKSPFVTSHLNILTPELQIKWGIDLNLCLNNATLAKDLPDLSAVWGKVFKHSSNETTVPTDVDAALYDGFINDEDRRTLTSLQKLAMLNPTELSKRQPTFSDPRLDEVFWRYRARNFPQILKHVELAQWVEHCRARLLNGAGEARTLATFLERITALENSISTESEPNTGQLKVLSDLRAYGHKLGQALS